MQQLPGTERYALPPELEAELHSPALVVYLDRARENIRRVIELAGGAPERWRPHVKTAKIPRVFAEYARAGVRNFKCATVREAEHLLRVLREEGADGADVLVAYPLIGPALARLGELARAHPETGVAVLCEDARAVDTIPAEVSVFVDVNPGMDRTGLPADELAAIRAVAVAAGERFRGVHGYDGHLHEGGWDERRGAAFACYDRLLALLSRLTDAGVAVGEVITSGTPTFQHALDYEGFRRAGLTHRVSPGTVVYHDLRTAETCERLALEPAALVFSRVVSHPAPDLVTCDAGSKALAAEAGDPCAAALGRPELVARTPNEEHLPLRVTSGPRPVRGERLLLFPRHVCPTVNLAEEAVLIEDGRLVDVVPVSARAHDVRT
jgi:D-serine deaminase-like pyridoxal phosphate-dependent protein